MAHPVSNADIAKEITDFKKVVEAEMKEQNKKIDKVLAAFEASKWVVRIIAGLTAIAASASIVWHNFFSGK